MIRSTKPNRETEDALRTALSYNPETGLLVWLQSAYQGRPVVGRIAGARHTQGYLSVTFQGRLYMAHRLAWFFSHGVWPEGLIDHMNGIKTDNRLVNLRDVSEQINQQNRRATNPNSATGLLGVRENGHVFQARIRAGGRRISLGNFSTADAAHAAYLRAKRLLHEGCTI